MKLAHLTKFEFPQDLYFKMLKVSRNYYALLKQNNMYTDENIKYMEDCMHSMFLGKLILSKKLRRDWYSSLSDGNFHGWGTGNESFGISGYKCSGVKDHFSIEIIKNYTVIFKESFKL